jgi:hypothetical protein
MHPVTNVSDASYTVLVTDRVVRYTSLSAPRIVTLPAPGSGGATVESPKFYTIHDRSGNCSDVNTITLIVSGGATINGLPTMQIAEPYGYIHVYDNGTEYVDFHGLANC